MKRLNDCSDVPEARLGILPKTDTNSKNKTRRHSTFPRNNGYSYLRQKKELEERESLQFIQEEVCTLSVRKTSTLLSCRPSRSLMTADGEVQTREEATVHSKHLDICQISSSS